MSDSEYSYNSYEEQEEYETSSSAESSEETKSAAEKSDDGEDENDDKNDDDDDSSSSELAIKPSTSAEPVPKHPVAAPPAPEVTAEDGETYASDSVVHQPRLSALPILKHIASAADEVNKLFIQLVAIAHVTNVYARTSSDPLGVGDYHITTLLGSPEEWIAAHGEEMSKKYGDVGIYCSITPFTDPLPVRDPLRSQFWVWSRKAFEQFTKEWEATYPGVMSLNLHTHMAMPFFS